MLVNTVLYSLVFICYNFDPLRTVASTDPGNGSNNVPHVEQIDIDKELQKEVNTLESRLAFVETTLQNFQNSYNVLKQNFDSLKTQFSQAAVRINQLENLTHQTVMDLHDQGSKYLTLQSINSNLQKTVDNTNVRLDDKTSALWTEIGNVTEEVVSISDLTNRSFDLLRNKNVLLENKFREISDNQSTIVSTLNRIKYPMPPKAKLVVFVAQLSRETLISTNEIIAFDKNQLNEGRGFDSHTGVFTATSNGIYTFSASVESTNCDVRSAIYRNNEQFVHVAGHYMDREGALGTATSYVHLDEGDRVWVQWMGGQNARVGHVRSQFTGHLIQETGVN